MNYYYCICFLFACAVAFSSCSEEESADMSCLTAEMCDMYIESPKKVSQVVTDDDRKLTFDAPLTVSWATKSDSLYRALVYYNSPMTTDVVTPLYAERVLLLTPHSKDAALLWGDNDDPVGVNSVWMSQNGKYLNMNITMKSGATSDEKQRHSIGVVCDTVLARASRSRHCYRFCHAQNDVPMHYTVDGYFSIPTAGIPVGDTISITIPTHDGVKTIHRVK